MHPLDLDLLNGALAAAPYRIRLMQAPDSLKWAVATDEHALDQVLWPLLWSAVDLLTSADVARVRGCNGEHCSWLFLDTTHNGTRRWCSMEDCGNRHKVRRHYARHHKRDEA
ncbi:MAG: hypothetical protein HC914_13385 [Chloroflexaceae bacterium]|nr:hypothetical protein [Chloroflexaceae bacterium]